MKALRAPALILGVVTLLVGLVPSAQANCNSILGCPLVIDDFTKGALPPANGPFEFTHLGLPTQSCLGGSRHVWIADEPTHSAGMVPLGGGDIGYQIQTQVKTPGGDVFTGAEVILDYEMPEPTDITVGGVNDRIVLDVVSESLMSVFMHISVPGKAGGQTKILHPGENVYLLSDFWFLDLTKVTRIEFYFHEHSVTGVASATLSRIRVGSGLSRYLRLELPELIEIGPPFPLPGPYMTVRRLADDGGVVDTEIVAMSLVDAFVLPMSPTNPELFPVQLRSSDSGLGRADPGAVAGFEFIEAAPIGGGVAKADHSDGYFSLLLELQSLGFSYPAGITMSEVAEIPNPDVFYIPFEVELLDEAGAPSGRAFHRLRAEIPDGVAYDFEAVRVHPPEPGVAASFGFEFELRDDGTSGKLAKAEGQPLFNLSLEGDWMPEIAATPVPISPLGNAALTLSAWPNVVSDRTQLRLSRGLDSAATIRIYDLAGRAVRSLRVAPGQLALPWNARDDDGRPLASGVYMARVLEGPREASQKLVILR